MLVDLGSWRLARGRASAYLSHDTTTFGQYGRKPNEKSAAPKGRTYETERTRSISDENAMTILCAAAKVRTFNKVRPHSGRESESRESNSKRNGYAHDDFPLYGSGADTATIARVTAREGPSLVRAGARAVEGGERMHFVGRELLGGRSHLLIDVILANPLGEGGELPFEVSGMLPLQRRSSDFETAGTVTGGAGRDATLRIAGKHQALRRIRFP